MMLLMLSALTLTATLETPLDADGPQAEITMWFVMFDETFPGADAALAAAAKARPATTGSGAARQTVHVLAASDIRIEHEGHELRFNKLRLDRSGPQDGTPPWTVLSAPRLIVLRGQEASIRVGEPVVYLERGDSECGGASARVVRSDDLSEGIEMRMTYADSDANGIRFSDVDIRVSRVQERTPVEGVPFAVGRPVMDTRHVNLGLALTEDQVAAIPLAGANAGGTVYVFMTARVIKGE